LPASINRGRERADPVRTHRAGSNHSTKGDFEPWLNANLPHGAGVLLVAKPDRLARDTMVAVVVDRLAQAEGE